MKTLLLTDLHLSNKNFKGVSLLQHQVDCLLDVIRKERADEIIIMGDIFMQRKPSPSAMLALKTILRDASIYASNIIMLRGNHDSETKADDGVTALSIFDYMRLLPTTCNFRVVTHAVINHDEERVYIPHYENQEPILKWLRLAPEGYTVFGHFGFSGCLNSVGDKDFDISPKEFKNRTYLGHIHKHLTDWNGEHAITVVGTPYTTNFGEESKTCYYGIMEAEDEDFTFKEVWSGPRHMVLRYKDLTDNFEVYKDLINKSSKSTLLRINIEKDDRIDDELLNQLDVIYLDFKFLPMEEAKQKDQSEFQPERDLFSINDQIIEDYVDKHNTSLDKEDIMWGLDILKDEDR